MKFEEHQLAIFLAVSVISGLVLVAALIGFWLFWRWNRRRSETVGLEPIPEAGTTPAGRLIAAVPDSDSDSTSESLKFQSSSSDSDLEDLP